MRNTILKVLGFLLFIVLLIYINTLVFRSEIPTLWFITFIGSVIAVIFIPYNKIFNNKKTN